MTREEFRKGFLKNFASNISPKVLKKYRIGSDQGLLWNLFAANLVPCFVGDAARKEYDKVDKTNAQLIEYDACWMFCYPPYRTPCSKPLPQVMLTAIEVDEQILPETYIFDDNFSWCYVITHELDLCGPYFCYNPNLTLA